MLFRLRGSARFAAAGLVLAGLLAGCSDSTAAGEPNEIVIGFPASLTGAYAALGQQGLNALKLFESWVNGDGGILVQGLGGRFRVRVVSADDASNVGQAAALFQQMVTGDRARFMMASYSSTSTLAQQPLAAAHNVLTFAWGAAADELWAGGNQHLVGVLTPASAYDTPLLTMMSQLTPVPARIALLHEDDPFAKSIADGVAAQAPGLGLNVVHRATYPAQPTDLSAELAAARAAAPDALLIEGHFADSALAARQVEEAKFNVALPSFGSGAATSTWATTLGTAAEYTVGTSQWEPTMTISAATMSDPRWYGPKLTPAAWAQWYQDTYQSAPDYRAMAMFNACLALKQAIERAGLLATDLVRARLREIDMLTTFGRFKLGSKLDQVGHEALVIQWRSGTKRIVFPTEQKTAELSYPVPRFEDR